MTVKDWQKVQDIIEQLCVEYAFAVNQPHARNGGLIGLAAAAIALGPVRCRRLPSPTAIGQSTVSDLQASLSFPAPPGDVGFAPLPTQDCAARPSVPVGSGC